MSAPHDLALPLGGTRSGRARYAAAMDLYNAGQIGPDALEVYRVCSLLDRADPARMLAEAGLPPTRIPALTGEVAIRALITAADTYLATLHGPGLAEVRQGLNRWSKDPVTALPAAGNAVLSTHLPAALAALAQTHPDLATAIAEAAPWLTWITYDAYGPEIGESFAKGHAFASLIGEEAALPAEDFDFGLFLMAPHVLYRDRAHKSPELYAPLTGPHGWRFGPDRPLIVKPAHDPVWNDPWRPHLTKIGPTPFLSLFAWTRDVQEPAQVIAADDWAELEALRLG